MTTILRIILLSCVCLCSCTTSRHISGKSRCDTAVDSTSLSIGSRAITSLTLDSLELHVIEITAPSIDSIAPVTMKIMHLVRSVDRSVSSHDSVATTLNSIRETTTHNENHKDMSIKNKLNHTLIVFLIILLLVLGGYYFIKHKQL